SVRVLSHSTCAVTALGSDKYWVLRMSGIGVGQLRSGLGDPKSFVCSRARPGRLVSKYPTLNCHNPCMTQTVDAKRPIAMPILLIITGAVGWWSAFNLVLDKIALLKDPQADLDCNFSLLVQCGANLDSWQGEVFFGVPNPIWGLGGFVA